MSAVHILLMEVVECAPDGREEPEEPEEEPEEPGLDAENVWFGAHLLLRRGPDDHLEYVTRLQAAPRLQVAEEEEKRRRRSRRRNQVSMQSSASNAGEEEKEGEEPEEPEEEPGLDAENVWFGAHLAECAPY